MLETQACRVPDLLHWLNAVLAKCGIHDRLLTMSRAGCKGAGVIAVGLAFRGGYWLAEICRCLPFALLLVVYVKVLGCERGGAKSYGHRWLHILGAPGLTLALAMHVLFYCTITTCQI